MMTEDIVQLMLTYKSALKKIEGGHSFSIIEVKHETSNRVDEENELFHYTSDISWLDLAQACKSYKLEAEWENFSNENAPMLIIQRMEDAWSFQKMFNSSKLNEFSSIESEVSSIIDKTEGVLKNLVADLVECKEMYLDLGGNDYWMIVISRKRVGIYVFEFLHFID